MEHHFILFMPHPQRCYLNYHLLDQAEFRAAMQVVDPKMKVADIDILFETIDVDNDQQISFIEFVAATIDPREVIP